MARKRRPPVGGRVPEHAVLSLPGLEPVETLEMHVLARAYRAAWRSVYASEPTRVHVIAELGVVLVYGAAAAPLRRP